MSDQLQLCYISFLWRCSLNHCPTPSPELSRNHTTPHILKWMSFSSYKDQVVRSHIVEKNIIEPQDSHMADTFNLLKWKDDLIRCLLYISLQWHEICCFMAEKKKKTSNRAQALFNMLYFWLYLLLFFVRYFTRDQLHCSPVPSAPPLTRLAYKCKKNKQTQHMKTLSTII